MESEAMPAAVTRIVAAALSIALGAAAHAQAPAATRAAVRAAVAPLPTIDVWPVRDNIYMLVGAGGNTTSM